MSFALSTFYCFDKIDFGETGGTLYRGKERGSVHTGFLMENPEVKCRLGNRGLYG
jgi:hypothetical protein